MNTRQAYINGFVKRANEYGYSSSDAIALLKTASADEAQFYSRVAGLSGTALAVALGMIAQKGMMAKNPKDRVNKAELEEWAKKYLKSDNIHVLPGGYSGNASYQAVDHRGQKHHVIRYDPRVGKSVGAHEIGHGMGSIPRVPLSSFLGPLLANSGAFMAGYTGGESGLLPLAAGVGIQVPTLADEWLASHNAKKILKENNVPAKGLTRAWLTYAAPLLTAGLAGGAGYLANK